MERLILTRFSKILLTILAGVLIGLALINLTPQTIVFSFIYVGLFIVIFLNIHKYILKPLKEKYKIRKTEKNLKKIRNSKKHLEDTLVKISIQLEKEINNPGVSEEYQMKCIDTYLRRKDALENMIPKLTSIIEDLQMHLEFYRRFTMARNFVNRDFCTNDFVALTHDLLEDNRANIPDELIDYEYIRNIVSPPEEEPKN
jgi:hypothetical protein